jgi:hypothetical protein
MRRVVLALHLLATRTLALAAPGSRLEIEQTLRVSLAKFRRHEKGNNTPL